MQTQRTIESVLEYYHSEVIPALSYAVTIDDAFPEEVLNELRNTLTHMARANHVGVVSESGQDELSAAMRHLKRSTLDCLKVSLLVLAQKCEGMIGVLTEDLRLPEDVYKKQHELKEERRRVSGEEGQRPTDSTIENIKSLVVKYDEFYLKLVEQFNGESANQLRNARNAREKKKENRALIHSFILGIITGIIGNFFFETIKRGLN